MSAKKLHYYLREADTTIQSYHLPLKKFLDHKTENTKVDNWSIDISGFNLKFEYIKGIKNTLADMMSRLVQLDPEIKLELEPEGYQFEQKETASSKKGEITLVSEVKGEAPPILDDPAIMWGIPSKELERLQNGDLLCVRIFNQMDKQGEKALHPYYKEEGVLKRYVHDNKQRFKITVVPRTLARTVLKLGHDELGHNGTTHTYMLLCRITIGEI